MAERRIYTQCGVRLRSAVELHLPPAEGDQWDVDVDWRDDLADTSTPPPGEVVAELDLPGEGWWYKATWSGSDYVLRFHDCGEFRVSADLDAVEVRASPSEQSAILPVLMAGTVSSFILTLRGATILHASAVAVDGRALAFVGPSGRGKSTMATLLCTVGAALVTDDVLAVQPGPPPTCIGGASELRLRPGAAALADGAATTRTTADERIALTVTHAPPVVHPLDAIVIPGPSREATALEVTQLSPSNALMAFLAFPRVYGWARADVLTRDFSVFGALVNEVPVFTTTIPWGPPFDPAIAVELIDRCLRGG